MSTVFFIFAADTVTSKHVRIVKHALRFGKVTAICLTNEVISSYKKAPYITFEERCDLVKSLQGVQNVLRSDSINFRDIILTHKPDVIVHTDDWRFNNLYKVRLDVIDELKKYGGRLEEIPAVDSNFESAISRDSPLSVTPDNRVGSLARLLCQKGVLEFCEVHSALSALLVQNATYNIGSQTYRFSGFWSSSLTDSTLKCLPDIEVVDITSRLQSLEPVLRATALPLMFDGDTGGKPEHLAHTVRLLERSGVSAIVIEDKVGLKKNSLFGNEVQQEQDSVDGFQEKLAKIKRAQVTSDFIAVARLESLILDKGIEDALSRASAYIDAGADVIMIHGRRKDPEEIFSFCRSYHQRGHSKPLMVVPTTFNGVTRDQWDNEGVRIICYANHLLRVSYPAMLKAAEMILKHGRTLELEDQKDLCMPLNQILDLIPGTR
jgi:phosphoenolpyruvate mutase